MAVKSIKLKHRNNLATDYVKGILSNYFSYNPYIDLEERVADLRTRNFPRQQLISILTETNKNWGASSHTLQQIERLKYENSVVVVGGQQAGLLTGPLYTIHKIISIIKFARKQEEKLNVPVIPLFWIAGEDHDYDEINHIYTTTENKLIKRVIGQEEWLKKSVSNIQLNESLAEQWVKQVFHDLVETEHTKYLASTILEHVKQSETFVDFFARLILELFSDEGLVLINSAEKNLRKLQSQPFEQLIKNQEQITNAVYDTAQKLHHAGYNVQVDVTKQDGNLFYHDESDERILLVRDGEFWVGKNDEALFTTDQLLEIARNNPDRLSNNVVTRPLMQESILPTLAFIAGDGEISYWALLKNAFRKFDEHIKMPPVVPRLSITFITERIDKLLNKRALDAPYIVNNGCKSLKVSWLSTQQNPPIQLIFEEAEQHMKEIHKPIQELAKSIGPDLNNEAKRNIDNILKELSYLKQKTMHQLQNKYSFELSQFQEINLSLRPRDELQERVLNIVSFLNECGPGFLNEILKQNLSFDKEHYLIYLNKL